MITINSQLDMTPGAIPVVIHRSQYDSDFSIVFTLFARTGDFTIASGTTARVRGTKKSGTGYSTDAMLSISAKTVTVYGDQQMTAVSGQNIFEIVLMNGTKKLCSANFILNVERAALDMDTITDDTVIRELDNLDQFITEAEAAADRAEDAAATFSVDATLTVSGKAADAKKTGDELAKKVDAVSGKGLSTNDYTDEEKTKLAGVETGANKTVIDTTLTQTGQAADAKAVGDAIASEDKKALAAFATDTASGAVANFPDGADSIPMKDVLIHIEPVQAGSGDPSPDNVRPITGWTGAKVTRTGKNLCESLFSDGKVSSVISGMLVESDNTCRSDYIPVNGGSVTFSCKNTSSRDIYVFLYGENKDFLLYKNSNRNSVTATHDDAKYAMIRCDGGTTADEPMLELGSTATDYEPYHADTYDITFPSEADTVYGGTLDVTNGELVVDRAMVDPGTLDWENYNVSGTRVFRTQSLANAALQYDGLNIICSNYPTVSASQKKDKSISIGSNSSVWIIDSNYSAVSTFKAAILGSQLVYELATPITYTLTPQEITSLLGENNLWADTGDSEVEYRADTKVYVDAKVAAAESNITSLQNSKVDKTTPLLNFDDTATDPLTDDGALANALRALGILNDVIE